jgi:2'-5' RNA ligase
VRRLKGGQDHAAAVALYTRHYNFRIRPGVAPLHKPGSLSYVVLDVPEPQASAVMAVRHAHADLFRAALPAEITLTDSFDAAQDADEAFATIDEIASATAPISTSFVGAHRFANSDAFVMRVDAEEPFVALRQTILAAGLKFEPPSPLGFIPHCTLRTRSPVTPSEAKSLLDTEIPGDMVLDSLSIYTLTRSSAPGGVECRLRHHARLLGSSN